MAKEANHSSDSVALESAKSTAPADLHFRGGW